MNAKPVAKVSQVRDHEMCEVTFEGEKVLLARVKEEIYAIGAHCPHYGVSLAEGLLCGDRIICPWHKSSFRVTDGTLLDPPAIDGLARFRVSIEDDDIYLTREDPQSRAPAAISTASDSRCFAIVGAGAAGTAAAESLRERGFRGRIVLISYEPDAPYDRTKLSKEFLSGNAGPDALPLRPRDFYHDNGIELTTKSVSKIMAKERRILFDDGSDLLCDSLLIASGSEPRRPNIQGAELGGVFVLRTQEQAQQLLQNSPPGVRAVIIGGSFIALEAASCFGLRQIPTTVVLPEQEPFEKQFGEQVGQAMRRLHEQHGIEFRRKAKVSHLEGTGVVQHVVLDSGERLPADLVLIGAGVEPSTGFVAGVEKARDGGIVVDRFLRAAPGVYAAGDVAVFPLPRRQEQTRIEHWRVAGQHGRTVAANMLGSDEPYEGVPYFWTNHFGTRFDYVGHAQKWDEAIICGDLNKPQFIAFYIQDNSLVAASGCGCDLEIAALHELMRLDQVPTPEQVRNNVDLLELARSACR